MSPQTFARMLYTHLNAEEVDCPAAVSEMIGGDQAVCAETDLQWRVIRKKTRLFLREYAPDDLSEHDLWDRDREFRRRQIMSTEEPVLLQFDIDRERFAILPHHPCFEPSLVESIGLVRLDEKGVSPLQPIHKARVKYPEAAWQKRASGRVLIEAVVLEDGSIGETCVMRSSRKGLGFEESALAAVSRWRYVPVTEDGVAVKLRVRIMISWSLSPL